MFKVKQISLFCECEKLGYECWNCWVERLTDEKENKNSYNPRKEY